MRIDGTRLDLRTMADTSFLNRPIPGGRRHLDVSESDVVVSALARRDDAGIGIGIPAPWITLHCKPRAYDSHLSPVDRDGWLNVEHLTPCREYWLEFDAVVGGIRVERSDSDGSSYRWYWPLPADLWMAIRCR